jgi:hypothetical protein
MSKETNTINCPSCGTEINVSEILVHQAQEGVQKEFKRKLAEQQKQFQQKEDALTLKTQELEKQQASIDKLVKEKVNVQLNSQKETLVKEIKAQAQEENKSAVETLQKELTEKTQQVAGLNKAKADILRLEREKTQLKSEYDLKLEEQLGERIKAERTIIQEQVENTTGLKLKEKEKAIEDLRGEVNNLKRKIEQGSVQAQGEIQELEIERILCENYPNDKITEVKKGARGADVLQLVINPSGSICGKIYYESKRTKNFENNWLQKLRDDNLEIKADVLVIVTETMPDATHHFFFKDGVWICRFSEIRALSLALRFAIVKMFDVAIVQHGKESKMELLYSYLTSQEFHNQLNAIVEGFEGLRKGYDDEKKRAYKTWAEREKQLDKVLSNTLGFYGSLKGIAGAAIEDIPALEEEEIKLIEE